MENVANLLFLGFFSRNDQDVHSNATQQGSTLLPSSKRVHVVNPQRAPEFTLSVDKALQQRWSGAHQEKSGVLLTEGRVLPDIRARRQMGAVYIREVLSSNWELKLLLNQPSRT